MGYLSEKDFQIALVDSNCCGVKEFHNIYSFLEAKPILQDILCRYMLAVSNPEIEVLQKHFRSSWPDYAPTPRKPSAHILFMGIVEWKGQYAAHSDKLLADYILEQKLGQVWISPEAVNGNTGHKVVTYVWTPDWDNCKLWWKANNPDETLLKLTYYRKWGNGGDSVLTRDGGRINLFAIMKEVLNAK